MRRKGYLRSRPMVAVMIVVSWIEWCCAEVYAYLEERVWRIEREWDDD